LFELVLRIGFSLLVVLGLMWAMARIVRRPLGAGRHHGPLAVLNRQQLTRGAAVTILKVGDRAMIIGVTDAQISLLGEADLEDFEHHHTERRNHVEVATPPLTEADLHDLAAGDLAAGDLAAGDLAAGDLAADHLPGAHPVPAPGRLDGSLLSPRTWASTMNFLRDRTTRR
jgi:flagellar protein FliO/FliZ